MVTMMTKIASCLFLILTFNLAGKANAYSVSSVNKDKWVPSYQKAERAEKTTSKEKEKEKEKDQGNKKAGEVKKAQAPMGIEELGKAFKREMKNKKELLQLKESTLRHAGKAVPILVEAMKDRKTPDRNRWMATFLLGRIVGTKSVPFISKFVNHPDWVMRMAALKTLLSLKEKGMGHLYAEKLRDSSYLVRIQALENISQLKLNAYASDVWSMLFDENNYSGPKGKLKRSNIIKSVIKTIGDLNYDKAKSSLMNMIQEKKYEDLFEELDYTLGRLTGKLSPEGGRAVKKVYWSRMSMKEKVF